MAQGRPISTESFIFTQEKKKISGIVTDEYGEPVIGANVVEKGTTNGTTTDIDGKFSLSVPENVVLQISYIGYITQEIPAKNQVSFSVTLREDLQALEEVVVVGYGTQKKVNLTGSVSTVASERLENRPVGSLTEGLQGTMSGVTIVNAKGEVGSNPSLQIRGFSSLNSGGALVIVDGVPGNMNNISPNDIASISILKDAASSSIYGARAAEGVVLITTKQGGTGGKVKIQYSNNFSFQTPTLLPTPNSSYDGALYANLAFTNAGGNPLYPEWMMEKFRDPSVIAVPQANMADYDYVADFNWWDYFMKKSFQQSQNVSLSGGSEMHRFMISASWLDQNGYFSKWGPDNFDRVTFRVNLNNQIIPKKLTLETNLSLVNADKDLPAAGTDYMMQSIRQAGNSLPLYNPDGTYARYRMQQNTMQHLKEAGFDETNTNRFEGRIALSWNVIEGLSLKALGGYNVQWDKGKTWQRAYYKYRPSGPSNLGYINQPNKLTEAYTHATYYIGQLQANYNKTFGKHNISALAGTSVEENLQSNLSTFRNNILGNELPAMGLGEASTAQNSSTITNDWGLVSVFGRINYNYNERYLLEANLRADGSSRFSDKNKWGVFPSVSLGWRITEEAFMQNQRLFSNLKLRLSYGELGNQNGLGVYDHMPVYRVADQLIPFPTGDQQQISANSLPSTDRTWETVTSYNLGIDMGFLNERLRLEADIYSKKNKDMLINIDLPSIIGITVPTGNYGELSSKGWEVSLHWNDEIKPAGLKYYLDFNIYDQTNELTDLKTSFAKPTAGVQNIQGYPINAIFAYKADGYFQSDEEVSGWAFQNANTKAGDIRYIDQNGDEKITVDDVVYV
ncbi:MAG: TonB-dependent receptor, partial [Tannerella sp.]|nr:TonB-dependent receptor [Tannerella sp.]